MYYLPIHINNRKFHICHLKKQEQPDDYHKPIFEFVIPNTENENKIFSILENAKFVALTGMQDDQTIKNTTINSQLEQGTLTLTFGKKKGQSTSERQTLTDVLAEKRLILHQGSKVNKGIYLTSAPHNSHLERIDVILQLCINDLVYAAKLIFHIASPDQIYDVMFDFGSEASQIAISRYSERKPRTLNVISRLQDYFYNKGKAESVDQYHQYDPGDPDLYKSIFFIKRADGKFDFTDAPNKHKDRELIKILTKRDKQDNLLETHFITPNLKLSELVDYFNEYIKFQDPSDNPAQVTAPAFVDIKEDIYRSVINKFIHIALAKIHKSANYNQKHYFNIILLVPNVYTQNKVYGLVENLYTDVGSYKNKYGFAGGEVQTLSESDASFLGMLSDTNITSFNHLKPKTNYLIIDAGKGTMDISIIRVNESDRNFSSIYRAGIAGSGHIITYAFIETLSALWMGRNKAKRRQFMLKIIQADTTKQLRFLEVVERLKKRYSTKDAEENKASIQLFKPILGNGCTTLEEVTDFLQQHLIEEGKTIDDYFSCIRNSVHSLADEIKEMVDKSGVKDFSKLVLAGRAFRFSLLVQAVIEKLQIAEIAYDAQLSKKICIVGATSNKTINHNSNLIGLPIIKPVFTEEVGEQKKSPFNFFTNLWAKLFKPKVDIPTTPPKITEIDVNADFFLNGFSVNLASFNVHVGGHRYVDNFPPQLKSARTVYNIFFTGKEFKVRTEDDSYILQPALMRYTVNSPVWKSIFPFLEWKESQLDDVPVADIGEEYDYYFHLPDLPAVIEDIKPETEIPATIDLGNLDDDIMEDLEKG